MVIAGFTVFLLGIILLISHSASKNKNARCSAQTWGVLMKTFDTENSSGSTGHAYIYSYYVDGVEYRLKSTASSKEAKNVGDPCTIWYNPAKPKDAQPFHYDSDKTYRIILLCGIASVLLGIVLIVVGAAHA